MMLASPAAMRAQDARASQPPAAAGARGVLGEPPTPLGAVDRPATLPDGTRRVEGRVLLVRDTALRPLPSTWVTLHRVGSDTAAPIDSVRTDGQGAFGFRYRPTGVADALYFASSSYGGIAYFTSALRDADVRGGSAEITVFDTTSRAVPVTVRGRHLIVSAPTPDGARNVIEVFELSNDTSVTAIPSSLATRGTWSVSLPPGARNFAVRPGELPADGMSAANGRAVLQVPFAPGLKQVAFSYQLGDAGLPLRVALEAAATVFEVLIEDPRGVASGAGLVATEAVALEGRTFRRFLAQDAPAGASVEVSLPDIERRWESVALPLVLVGIGGGMLLLLLRSTSRGRSGRTAPTMAQAPAAPRASASPTAARSTGAASQVDVVGERERLLQALAALDDAFEARGTATAHERAAYEHERATLKARLATRLAAGEGRG
jgi:hypothetical protein